MKGEVGLAILATVFLVLYAQWIVKRDPDIGCMLKSGPAFAACIELADKKQQYNDKP